MNLETFNLDTAISIELEESTTKSSTEIWDRVEEKKRKKWFSKGYKITQKAGWERLEHISLLGMVTIHKDSAKDIKESLLKYHKNREVKVHVVNNKATAHILDHYPAEVIIRYPNKNASVLTTMDDKEAEELYTKLKAKLKNIHEVEYES